MILIHCQAVGYFLFDYENPNPVIVPLYLISDQIRFGPVGQLMEYCSTTLEPISSGSSAYRRIVINLVWHPIFPDENKVAYGYVSPSPYGPVGYGPGVGVGPVAVPSDVPGYDEGHPVPLTSGVPPGMFDDEVHLQRLQSRHPVVPGMASPLDDDQKSMRWRDPNLSEVIGFLSNPNNIIKANAAAYLQHLCYMDDPNKQKTRSLGGIPPLVQLLDHDNPDVYRNACGALRNLSYGRQNDENKRAIKNAGGVPALINLLRRTSDADVKELVTGVLWNLSSCEVGRRV